MSKHQTCKICHCDFVGPDSNIGENNCPDCDEVLHADDGNIMTQNDFKPDWSEAEAAEGVMRESMESLGNILKQRDDLLAACEDMASALNGLHLGTVIGITKLEMAVLAEVKGRQAIAQVKKG